jgi:hypothetical protein
MPFARIAAMSLLYGVMGVSSVAAQQPGPALSLSQLQGNASRAVGKMAVVRCHFSANNGLPIIFDDGHKTTFPVSWSDQIRNTPQYRELIQATETDWLVFTGRLENSKNFVIYDGQFDKTPHVTIKIIDARNNHPISDEKLNVALREDQIGSVAMPTDKNGAIDVTTGSASIIRVLSNMYADCRPREELYKNYSLAQIRETGIVTGNLCSAARPQPKPGELVLFEVPRTFIPSYPKPPLSPEPLVPVPSTH